MKKIADIKLENKTLFISGDLDFANVMSVYGKSLPLIQQCPELIFNFEKLKSSDSSGLALLIEWIKLSKLQKKSIQFLHLSDGIVSIAQAASMNELIFKN